jgi:hypothetical protein
MTLLRLTAEASVYHTRNAYRSVPGARRDSDTSVAPAFAANRIVGLKAVRDYINRIDLTAVKAKLSLPPSRGGHSWTAERADAAATKYKKWLLLQRKCEDALMSPGSEVDHMWHFHILDTRAYIRDTARIFGHYLHHYPYFGMTEGMAKISEIFETTRRLYRAEYGEDL